MAFLKEFQAAVAKAQADHDICARLRSWHLPPGSSDSDARMRVELMREAADYIDKLREEVPKWNGNLAEMDKFGAGKE